MCPILKSAPCPIYVIISWLVGVLGLKSLMSISFEAQFTLLVFIKTFKRFIAFFFM
jgi:hypothetical protein